MVSALLTAIYMLTIVVRAFFPGRDFNYKAMGNVEKTGWKMIVPLLVFVVVIFFFGLHSGPIIHMLEGIAGVE